ncbi:MAG: mannose-6-phosphate isomerase, class I, partial [Flavisolibacter sp.]
VFRLKGVVQHYSWGGYQFIPQLLGVDNKQHKPFAEYWMGAHQNHPAHINGNEALNDFIAQNAQEVLGNWVNKKFGSLPYLLKVLDVRQMLSIQVHPSKEAAEASFEHENRKNIPANAPHRNYKDQNHKPELMVALSDFWLLHGFKKKEELIQILNAKAELQFLMDIFIKSGYKGLYEEVMLMGQERVNKTLLPLLDKVAPLYKEGAIEKDKEDFWAARAALDFCKNGRVDRGIFSIYLFNLVHLKEGEGIFQASGLPHAYLEGQNVEIMANSDNVLRAGLTDKHIDVPELLKHVKFETTIPNILKPQSNHKVFTSPAEEFELQEYSLREGVAERIRSTTGEIFFLMDGTLTVDADGKSMQMEKGECIFVTAGTELVVKPSTEVNLFRATVP